MAALLYGAATDAVGAADLGALVERNAQGSPTVGDILPVPMLPDTGPLRDARSPGPAPVPTTIDLSDEAPSVTDDPTPVTTLRRRGGSRYVPHIGTNR